MNPGFLRKLLKKSKVNTCFGLWDDIGEPQLNVEGEFEYYFLNRQWFWLILKPDDMLEQIN